MKTDLLVVHHPKYEKWAFSQSHPTQGRRFVNAFEQTIELAKKKSLTVDVVRPRPATRYELETQHASDYIAEVLDYGESGEWVGSRPELGRLAQLMAGGTMVALEALKDGETLTAVNFAGAKHHAMWNRSSGFCVFGDFAIAANQAHYEYGWKTLIIDIDAHHGDGTERMTLLDEGIMTWSIHQDGIFPGTGEKSAPHLNAYNIPLLDGHGDAELLDAIRSGIKHEFAQFAPDFIMIAGGADGHESDPLSGLKYTVEGITEAMREIRYAYRGTPILFGGAGGYQPDTFTPQIWAEAVTALAETVHATPLDLTDELIIQG